MAIMTYSEAVQDAIQQEMRRDPNVFIAGEDVTRKHTKVLLEEFGPKRVRDTPISESQIISLGVGAAAMGLRPILIMSFMDFLGCSMDEIMNQAAKMTYMLGGQTHLPMTICAAMGAGIRAAAQHSQSLEAIFAHLPGLKVVTLSCPKNAKGLMAQAIRDENPVLVLEHKALGGMAGEVPGGPFAMPFGKADVLRAGVDVTLISWGRMVHRCMDATAELEKKGIDAEVIDIVSLVPFDEEGVLASAAKTGRVVIAHEATEHGGFGGEIAARIADKGYGFLKGPIKRIGAPFVPVPFSPVLEDRYIPSTEQIVSLAAGLF
ncbi:MAG: alpha-ketoacid dehydrogenase subunit beta [Clostridiales Family XIII bacterium]|jgi:pyruvate dehydrogenase E1 component beta subunit|nr:alpha-ketoacid dehydrogenase subunit beta [Clostridiales Family XIII bacterium]